MKTEKEYVEIAGVKWAKMNVGAEKETDIGLYFQYGAKQGYPHPTNLCKFDKMPKEFCDSVHVYWGDNWRMPTKEEFELLCYNTTNEWVKNYKDSGVNGRLFTDKTDTSKKLFFPACGYCGDGSVNDLGDVGFYWSSSIYCNNMDGAWCLVFYYDSLDMGVNDHCYGFSVRGVLN